MKKLLTLILFALSFNALADDLKFNCTKNPYIVGLYVKGGFFWEGKGLDVDLFDEIAKRTKCKFEFVTMERAVMWSALKNGDIHIGTVGLPTPERETLYHFITYTKQKNILILHNSVDRSVTTLDALMDVPGLTYCTVKGFVHGLPYEPIINAYEPLGRVKRFPDQLSVFKAVAEGKECQAMTAYPISYNKFVRELNLLRSVHLGEYLPDSFAMGQNLMLTKIHFTDADAAQWRRLIQQMRVEGKLYRLHLPYLKMHDAALAAGE